MSDHSHRFIETENEVCGYVCRSQSAISNTKFIMPEAFCFIFIAVYYMLSCLKKSIDICLSCHLSYFWMNHFLIQYSNSNILCPRIPKGLLLPSRHTFRSEWVIFLYMCCSFLELHQPCGLVVLSLVAEFSSVAVLLLQLKVSLGIIFLISSWSHIPVFLLPFLPFFSHKLMQHLAQTSKIPPMNYG